MTFLGARWCYLYLMCSCYATDCTGKKKATAMINLRLIEVAIMTNMVIPHVQELLKEVTKSLHFMKLWTRQCLSMIIDHQYKEQLVKYFPLQHNYCFPS